MEDARLVNYFRKLILSTKDDGQDSISQTLVRQYLIPNVMGFYRVYIYRMKGNFSLIFIGAA